MRKILLLVASLGLVSVVVAAQHVNTNEKTVKSDLTVPADVMVGTTMLKAGEYKIACDREMITFADHDTGKVALKVECKGKELREPSKITSLYVATDASGTRRIQKLLVKGSTIEHVFQ
ncbi:MAG: hypothetical protein NUW22_13610 [Acidobacteria bacterium]|nr:hypothetical protein [Acidobacteriota bacterium]